LKKRGKEGVVSYWGAGVRREFPHHLDVRRKKEEKKTPAYHWGGEKGEA